MTLECKHTKQRIIDDRWFLLWKCEISSSTTTTTTTTTTNNNNCYSFYMWKKEWESWGVYGLGFGVLQHEVENLLQENLKEESQGLEILLQ
jgi:hypothetical protein